MQTTWAARTKRPAKKQTGKQIESAIRSEKCRRQVRLHSEVEDSRFASGRFAIPVDDSRFAISGGRDDSRFGNDS